MNQTLVGDEQQSLEQRQEELLREYYLWANASEKDIARGLEANVNIFSAADVAGEGFREFMEEYAQNPQETLEATRQRGEQKWAASVPTIDSESHLRNGSGDQMELESDDEERDVGHLVHPDNIVFQSQLEPIPVAQVTSKHAVKDASVLEPTMATYNYQDQIDELNTKSINMYSWMLHAQEQPLYELMDGPSKVLSTRDWETVRDELVWVRAMERIEELKEKGKWSFWQPRRHRAPPRSKAHWDHVLAEMQWMHEDFTEERKLKRAMANMVASWIMDYHYAFDKSRYTIAGHKRLLPEHFISKLPTPANEVSSEEEVEVKAEKEPDLPTQTEDAKDKNSNDMEVESNAAADDTASVPASAPEAASERDSSETPLEAIVKTEAGSETQPLANDSTIPGADSVGDHIVPSAGDIYDNPELSIYHLLSRLRDTQGAGEILGDGLYALQSFSKLAPYAPAWDEPYCNILDASPVVPICKTMWASGDETNEVDWGNEAIDEHELQNLAADDSWRAVGTDTELPGPRSIFTRNMLAPPLLPMFTQANKQLRNTHSSAGQPPADTPIQQAAIEACPGQAVFEWTLERDKLLARLVQQYTGNWRLIADSFNHACSLYGSRTITTRACYERWIAIKEDYSLDRSTVQTGFDEPDYQRTRNSAWGSHLSVQPAATQLSAMQLATSLVSHSESHKMVKESKKKREAAEDSAPVPPRDIKPLPADQKVPTPGELSKLKFENDRRIQQLFMEQRQATAAAAALAMQQQRAMNPQLQAFQINRQIAVLQAMLASGRGLQRPLTPAQSRTIQQQLHNLQLLQQQQQQQQQQNGGAVPRQQLPQQIPNQASPQLASVQSPQSQQLQQLSGQQLPNGLGQQLSGGAGGLQPQTQSPAMPNTGSPGLRFTPEQIQQILQSRAANGARPALPPALAAMLNARNAQQQQHQQQQQPGANGNVRPLAGMSRPLNPMAAAAAMLPPQQRQLLLQQLAQQQLAQQQQQSMQRPPGITSPQPAMMPMAMSPQAGVPQLGQQQQQQQQSPPNLAPGAGSGSVSNSGLSPVPNDPTAALQASPTSGSVATPQLAAANNSVSSPLAGGSAASGAGVTPAQAQALLAAQQAMQFKQMQGQAVPPQANTNQPQLAQYLSGLFPHQLAQLSNQQRMNFMMMRQLQQLQQQQPQQQQQQFAGMNQPNNLQAMQQNLMAGAATAGSQQQLMAQLAQNMKNQQMLTSAAQSQASPRPQLNLNQLQMMRLRQQQQQQQASPSPAVSNVPIASPAMPGQATQGAPAVIPQAPVSAVSQQESGSQISSPPPTASTPAPAAGGTQQQGGLRSQQMTSPRPQATPQPGGSSSTMETIPGMQPSQQAMMLAAATAAGLSTSTAQALIAQIAANAEANQQQQQSPAASHATVPAAQSSVGQRSQSITSTASSGASTPAQRAAAPRPPVRPAAVRPGARPPVRPPMQAARPPPASRTPMQQTPRPRPHPHMLQSVSPTAESTSKGESAVGSSRDSTPSTPVKPRPAQASPQGEKSPKES